MMKTIPAPTSVTYTDKKNNITEVVIEPCYPGYGTTIGNALRRVLLSSLPGSAVTSIKIRGIQHEYDTVEHVKEDVVEIMMNLKHLHVVCHSDEPVTLELNAKGEKEVTAGDIQKNSDVEVMNKDLVIATITDKKGEFSMEITVKKGVGYEPVEERVIEKKEIGAIQIDSIFSPIANVGFNVELVRVGQRTDYEKIILQLTTKGTIKAFDAVQDAIQILQDQFSAIAAIETKGKETKKKSKDAGDTNEEAEDSADSTEE